MAASCGAQCSNIPYKYVLHITMHLDSYLISLDGTVRLVFLSRVSILTRDIDIANLSVCLSVRPKRSGIR